VAEIVVGWLRNGGFLVFGEKFERGFFENSLIL
jgi:hypothetical protein